MARYVHPHFQPPIEHAAAAELRHRHVNRGIYSVQSQAAVETEIEKYQAAQSKRAAE